MTQLRGSVCVVTGASRGIGKGIALALGAAGATVYVTGRSLQPTDDSRGSLSSTVEKITAMGGTGISAQCDHSIDSEVQAVIRRIGEEQGRLSQCRATFALRSQCLCRSVTDCNWRKFDRECVVGRCFQVCWQCRLWSRQSSY
jgi:NAD(P)-dependent dehydrogenase (short-subunit alcohol dehydrogenase family)